MSTDTITHRFYLSQILWEYVKDAARYDDEHEAMRENQHCLPVLDKIAAAGDALDPVMDLTHDEVDALLFMLPDYSPDQFEGRGDSDESQPYPAGLAPPHGWWNFVVALDDSFPTH